MTLAPNRPLAEVTTLALRVLIQEMGVVNTIRFLNQFSTGAGDYTREKDHLFQGMTVDDLAKAIAQHKGKPLP